MDTCREKKTHENSAVYEIKNNMKPYYQKMIIYIRNHLKIYRNLSLYKGVTLTNQSDFREVVSKGINSGNLLLFTKRALIIPSACLVCM